MILLVPSPVLAAGGSILYLVAWGGYAPGTTVYVQSTVQATPGAVNKSNLYYTISLGSTIYATHTTNLGKLNAYQTITDEWTTTNTNWPEGDYTISVCWSTGNSQNCDIAGPVTTAYHFVPTLGWGFSLVALILLLGWLWRRRKEFDPAIERMPS